MTMINAIKYLIVLILTFVFISCNEYLPAVEPVVPTSQNVTTVGDFAVKVFSVSDMGVYLTWTASSHANHYDILVNDTMAIHGITDNYYSVYGLKPNTDQKITIRAVSADLSVKSTLVTFKTKPVFFENQSKIYLNKYAFQLTYYTSCRKTADGGYVLVATGTKNANNSEAVIKTDSSFKVLWVTEIAFGGFDLGTGYGASVNILNCSDGGFLIANRKKIAKVSSSGVLLWRDTPASSEVNDVVELSDGSYLGVGTISKSFGGTNMPFLFVKYASNGTKLWEKYSGVSSRNIAYRIVSKGGGHYWVSGNIESSDPRMNLMEIDESAVVLSEKVFSTSTYPFSLLATGDGNFYAVGTIYSGSSYTRSMKLSSDGTILWDLQGGTAGGGNPQACSVLTNHNLLMAASTYSTYLIRELNPDGTLIANIPLYSFSNCVYIDKDSRGRYMYVTANGDIYWINPDGYRSVL
ncbi:fibronectin type III domain-containing protein [Paludibacter jiangxiensis]|uniref:Fibronectin type-III domain-containing protein n=1 Tax=Paludibacter jiangxiensis TaxID=681398 RepID=A0A171AQL5_9BACT|nr:fibronectin type III domain-containing protein [Paludibacter jiangxiensis]GAT64121.1 hypothetical protein PJIAN_4670 [Paludibacter jiangxiensis]